MKPLSRRDTIKCLAFGAVANLGFAAERSPEQWPAVDVLVCGGGPAGIAAVEVAGGEEATEAVLEHRHHAARLVIVRQQVGREPDRQRPAGGGAHHQLAADAGLAPVEGPAVGVVRGAGGVITDWRGGPAYPADSTIACATPELHAAVLAALNA